METAAKDQANTTEEPLSPPTNAWATLDLALLGAQRMAGTILKSKWNAFGNYAFASGEVLIDEGREYLLANGLTFVQRGQQTIDDKYLRIEYILTHAASGEKQLWTNLVPAAESKGKPLDKAVAGALTYDFGYTIRGLLLLPRKSKDELDPDERDDAKHVPAAKVERARAEWAPVSPSASIVGTKVVASFLDDDVLPTPTRAPYQGK